MQNKNFLLLWTGKLVSSIGDKLYAIAMAWWILEVTKSTAMMGMYLLTTTLPMVVMGIVAGAIIDKSNLKHVLVIADAVRGVGIVLLGLLYFTNSLTLSSVFLITVVISLASAFFNPAVTTIIPRIVSNNEFGKANSIIQLVDGIAKVLGPFAGVAIVASIGYFGAFMINGVSFLISAFFEGFIHYEKETARPNKFSIKDLVASKGLIEEIKIGFQYVWSNSKLMSMLTYVFIAHLFFAALTVMIPFMAKFVSNDNLNLLGVLETTFGAGFVLGALILSKKGGNKLKIEVLPKIFIFTGCGILSLGLITLFDKLPVILFAIPIFIIGYCIVMASIILQTFLQTDTPKEKLGRVTSISALIGDITLPLAFALYGVLLDKVNFVALTILSGMLLITTVVMIDFYLKRKLTRVTPISLPVRSDIH